MHGLEVGARLGWIGMDPSRIGGRGRENEKKNWKKIGKNGKRARVHGLEVGARLGWIGMNPSRIGRRGRENEKKIGKKLEKNCYVTLIEIYHQ